MRTTGKPFSIDKKQVYEAYKAVKSNAGSASRRPSTFWASVCCRDTWKGVQFEDDCVVKLRER